MNSTALSNEEITAREVRRLELDLTQERLRPYVVDMSKALPDIEHFALTISKVGIPQLTDIPQPQAILRGWG